MTDPETRRLFDDLMNHVPLDQAARDALWLRMNEPSRLYHHAGHLATLWSRHCEYIVETNWQSAAATRVIACAIAYHDAVYDSRRNDNEARSADLWMEVSATCPLDDDERQWVATTIRATADHLSDTPDVLSSRQTDASWFGQARLWMIDLDLTPLGERPEVFESNSKLLRDEAPHLSFEQWDAGRLNFLRRFQTAPRIYRSTAIAAHFEQPARLNLARHLC